ncbi:MAG TPA: hypothetical protein VD969_10665 [Symbiobacteriaceae bacterium]|nr:hypothetical protein [Symbiobacteriaceae bacterium]
MKKLLSAALGLLVSVSLMGCVTTGPKPAEPNRQAETPPTAENEEAAVRSLVETFGSRPQAVSLQAPADALKKSMQEHYGDLVSAELLSEWAGDPKNAPGRLTSSPWPDRIEILSVRRVLDGKYEVQGEVIEVTSVEKVSGGVAAKRPITLTVEKVGDRWLITGVTLGAYAESLVYRNTEFGFTFLLPASWQGYKIVPGQWEGLPVGGSQSVEKGPLIAIRHPQWTEQTPRQDIPIMVFTVAQWNSLQAGAFHIGAAPIGPTELGRNDQFVFALPARYNYAFPPGYEEVESILKSHPLRPLIPRQK